MIDEAYTVKGQMEQRERHHEQAMRASALDVATRLIQGSPDIVADLTPEGAYGTRKLELLANNLLTYIETGKFL